MKIRVAVPQTQSEGATRTRQSGGAAVTARGDAAAVRSRAQVQPASGSRPQVEHDLRRVAVTAPDAEGDVADLLRQVLREPGETLPQQALLERSFGRPLGEIRMHRGPQAQALLTRIQARAAAYRGAIILGATPATPAVLAHEVVHILQQQAGGSGQDRQAAEREAATLAQVVKHRMELDAHSGAFLPLEPTGVPAETLLCQTAVAEPPVQEQTPAGQAESFRHAADGASPPAPADRAGQPQEAAALSPETQAGAQDELETPAAPAPGVSPDEMAARQEEMTAAQDALESAESAGAVVDAFAAAPPSLKAQMAGQLGERVNGALATETAAVQEATPEVRAELSHDAPPAAPLSVPAPAGSPVDVEPTAPPAAPDLDLPPTPAPGSFQGNAGVVNRVTSAAPGANPDRAAEVGGALRDVQTRDPGIQTTPGPAPRVPLEGETDPQRLSTQMDNGREQARSRLQSAQDAVRTGPGPEQVQPTSLDERQSVGELAAPAVSAPTPPAGVEEFQAMELPPEVQTAFDANNGAEMQANMAAAQNQVQQATTQRDQEHQTQVQQAEQENQRLVDEADADQRRQVTQAREQIQGERRRTLEEQNAAVQRTESQAEERRGQDRSAIDNRVQQDQQAVEGRYRQADREAEAEVDGGERRAEERRRQAERDAENQSWWDRAVNFIRDAFNALVSAIGAIFDAVRRAVNVILDAARDFAVGLINLASRFIQAAIAAFGQFLTGLVQALLGDIFPGLAAALTQFINRAVTAAQQAVEAVAAGLRSAVNTLVEGLRAGINAVLNTFQAAITTGLAILEAAMTGDWSALARKVLEAVLRVLGIEPETFYAFIGRVQETFHLIVDNPGAFVGHLVDAVKEGIRRFAGNFLQHLQAGIIGWLTGALGTAGITLPERFDLMGVLSLVQQILGLTWANIRQRAVRLVGERAVQALEFVAGYVQTLIEGGWSALWERIRNDLASLRDMVLEQIRSFLVERIVMAAITRLATMFNPVGALVNLVLMIYNFIMFLRDQLQRIMAVAQTVVEGLSNIARGIIAPAAQRVENVLAGLLPLAIDLLARLLGLGNVGERVRSIFQRVQDALWGAIDRLLDRVLARFRGGGAGAEAGAQGEAEAAAGRVPDEQFSIGRARHTLRAQLGAGRPTILMASNGFQEVPARALNLQQIHIGTRADQIHPESTTARQAVAKLGHIIDRYNAITGQAAQASDPVAQAQVLADGMDELNGLFSELGRSPFNFETEAGLEPLRHDPGLLGTNAGYGRASGVVATISSVSQGQGSSASADPPGINILRHVPGAPTYQRGHLLAQVLGGPGNTVANLAPMSPQSNSPGMRDGPERDANGKISNQNTHPPYLLRYSVRCRYPNNSALVSQLTNLGINAGAANTLFHAAETNEDLTDTAIAAKPEFVGKSLTAGDYVNIRKKLARSFMAESFEVEIRPLQGEFLNVTSHSVTNHRGVAL